MGAALSLVALLGPSGCSRAGRARELSLEERGALVFQRACAGCHGRDGRGGLPPGYSVRARDLTAAAAHPLVAPGRLEETIRRGRGQMPPFGAALPEEDVRALVAFVPTLSRGPVDPAAAPAPSGAPEPARRQVAPATSAP